MKSLENMKQTLYIIYIVISVLTISCTGCDTKDAAIESSTQGGFIQVMGEADSLYNRMQFRDAYNLYLQLLDNEEVKADSEKKLDVLNSLCNCSELSGHKAEQTQWLQQLISLAKQTGNDYYHAMGLGSMGLNIFYEASDTSTKPST